MRVAFEMAGMYIASKLYPDNPARIEMGREIGSDIGGAAGKILQHHKTSPKTAAQNSTTTKSLMTTDYTLEKRLPKCSEDKKTLFNNELTNTPGIKF